METPIRRLEPELIAPDTHLVRQLFGEGAGPVAVMVNSMVITGDEPIIVDTGPAVSGDLWLADAFDIVDPADVRWIFLSHDDHDHTGNLLEVLDRAPNATLVTTWFMVERLAAAHALPMERMRWVNDGESFTAGDRELVAVTPPIFDSPTSRGLFDKKTGVYWAVDSFSTPVTHEVTNIDELDPGFWRDGFLQFQRLVSPWHQWLDAAKYGAHLQRVHDLGATTVANAHGPAMYGSQIERAFELFTELPSLPEAPLPGQVELEAIMAAVTTPVEQPVQASAA